MKNKPIKKTVYYVHLPYPDNKTFRMVKCNEQPFFLAKDIAKAFNMSVKDVLEIASPHISQIMHVKVISLYGYWENVLLGKSKVNRTFQHTFIHTALDNLYEDNIKKYLEIVQESDKNAKHRPIKTTTESFQ